MDETEYVAPGGASQLVGSPVLATRLRAAGWRPRKELEDLAPFSEAAAEHLQRAKEHESARARRAQERASAAGSQEPAGQAEAAAEPKEVQEKPAAQPEPRKSHGKSRT